MRKKTEKRPCFVRAQYRAVKALVDQKLAEGYSNKAIYEELFEAGRLSMSYTTFCDYVRGDGTRLHRRKNESRKRGASEMLADIADSLEIRNDVGCNLKLVYQQLVECGLTGFSYSDFFDYFRECGAYLGSDIPDDFVFFGDDGLITFYYRLESLLKDESDKAAWPKLH